MVVVVRVVVVRVVDVLLVCVDDVVVFVLVLSVDIEVDDVDVLVVCVLVVFVLDVAELVVLVVVKLVVKLVVTVIDDVNDKHCDISSCKDSISPTSCRNSSGNCIKCFPSACETHTLTAWRFSWKSLRHVSNTSTSLRLTDQPSLHASSHLATAFCSETLPKQ